MAELQEIRVTIDRDGRVSLDVDGVEGDACLELTDELERYLGGELDRRRKSDTVAVEEVASLRLGGADD